ncbi:MAG: adenylate cyclase, partial [Pseudomonadota bacterium]|nr:adenylate cyclase [Pseudomonadota bacterium]
LGVPTATPEDVARLTPAQRLDRTIDALIGQLRRRSQLGPALMVFEDAHWADPTSAALLDRAVRSGGFDRAMLLITARPEFQPAWAKEPHVLSMVLPPLGPEDGAALIGNIAGAEKLPAALKTAILERADGVPLFLEELTRSTVELMAHAGEDAAMDLPSTLQDSLSARLDRLGPAKELAQLGSVIGRKFSGRLLAKLTDRSPQEQARGLERLLGSGLIVRAGPGEQDEYRFRHVLVHETAYASLLRADRRSLNDRLVEVLEAEFPQFVLDEPERLAHYAGEAGLPEKAAGYWLRAGLQALMKSAMPEAIARLRRGLAAVAQLPHGVPRWRLELELELALGKAQIATIGYAVPATGETFARAKALCEAIGERSRLAAVLHGLWTHDLLCGRLRSAKVRADELLELAETEQDSVWTLIGLRAQGVLGYPLGNFKASRLHLERGLALFDPARRADYGRIVVDDVRVVMAMYLSWILVYLGQTDEGRRLSEESLAEARALEQPYTLAHALSGRILTGLFLEEHEGLAVLIEELAELTREHGINFYGAVCEILRGRYLVVTGEVDEGTRVLDQALQAYRATDSALYLPTFMMWRAEALGRSGRIDEGLALIRQAEALMERTGTRNDAAEVLRVEGELLLAAGDRSGAEMKFRQAHAVAAGRGALLHQRRAERSLAALGSSGRRRAPGRRRPDKPPAQGRMAGV